MSVSLDRVASSHHYDRSRWSESISILADGQSEVSLPTLGDIAPNTNDDAVTRYLSRYCQLEAPDRWLAAPVYNTCMTTSSAASYKGHRFPAEIIAHAVWRSFRFPLNYRQVEKILAARGIVVSYEAIRKWGRKFGQTYANALHRRRPQTGDKWHLDLRHEVASNEWSGRRVMPDRLRLVSETGAPFRCAFLVTGGCAARRNA